MIGGFFSRLKDALTKTRQGIVQKIQTAILGHRVIDEELYEEIEAILVQADVGVQTTAHLLERLKARVSEERVTEPSELIRLLKEEMGLVLQEGPDQAGGLPVNRWGLDTSGLKPAVIMVVGVNGTGKTTTVGKMAARFREQGLKVMMAAADTFRAAAAEQLAAWAGRVGADLVRHSEGADPSAVAFDAVKAAIARGSDVVLIDTAGRLHTKTNLMEELKKIRRVVSRELTGAPHEVLLVLDATTGQNAMQQARLFADSAGVTGIVLTKLDGTAKGGIVISIKHTLCIPVKMVGIGEDIDDLQVFSPGDFLDALFNNARLDASRSANHH